MPQVALVTGGASGIGRAACVGFAKLGIAVVIADVDEAGAKETLRQVSALHDGAEFAPASPPDAAAHSHSSSTVCRTDVSQEKDVKQLMLHIRSIYGRLDYCFNNAGIEGDVALTADLSTDSWDKVMSVNARGVFLCLKHQIPLMLETAERQGAIVITSSTAGVSAVPFTCAYSAAKHAVVGMMRCAAAEYTPQGLRINCINPGPTDTPMVERFTAKFQPDTADIPESVLNRAVAAGTTPLGRLATAQEVADAAVWLCTKATFMSGQTLLVDGGYSCR